MKNSLTVKQSLNVYLILLLLSSLVGYANSCSEECLSRGRAGGIGDKFMEPRGRWPDKVWE
jgi:hypothetical protein